MRRIPVGTTHFYLMVREKGGFSFYTRINLGIHPQTEEMKKWNLLNRTVPYRAATELPLRPPRHALRCSTYVYIQTRRLALFHERPTISVDSFAFDSVFRGELLCLREGETAKMRV